MMIDEKQIDKTTRASLALGRQLARCKEELARSDAVRSVLSICATTLLRSPDPAQSIPKVLELVGGSTDISRIFVCESLTDTDGRTCWLRRFAWSAPAQTPTAADLLRTCNTLIDASMYPKLACGEAQIVVSRTADPAFRAVLAALNVRTVLLVPICIEGNVWGHIGFSDCIKERIWSAIEIDTLKTMSEMIGAAVLRARDLQELADAGRIVENSSAILYRISPASPYVVTYVSRNVSRYGHSAKELLSSPTRYFELVHPNDRPGVLSDIARVVEGRIAEVTGERRIRRADGRYVWFECRTRAIFDTDNQVKAIEGVLVDIDDRKRAEERFENLRLTDSVTGLPNRRAFMDKAERIFAEAKRGAPPFSILYLDIDHFKDINDVLGHSKGDELLKLVTQRLKALLRADDVLARFGGDEFAILEVNTLEASDAGALAARIIHDIAEPFDIGTEVRVTVSIGVSVFGPDISGPEEMIKNVDLALYRSKESGRNQYHFHSNDLDTAVIERVTLAGALRAGIGRGELELHYQPLVDVATGRIVGLEALVRWHHPTLGLLGPNRFISVAEATGTIVPLGQWVLDEACRQISVWRADGIAVPLMAINVSAVQLKPDNGFDVLVEQSLERWQIEPEAIEIELTESILMETTLEKNAITERLRMRGLSIAIDDFGTGYSSLNYLRAYRVTHLKIAQEFIHELRPDSGDAVIVRATVGLANELGIKVVAEGVETAFQLDQLTKAGCRCVQGYYFSKPVVAERTAEMLRRGVIGPASLDDKNGSAATTPIVGSVPIVPAGGHVA